MSWQQTVILGNVGGDPRFTHLPSGTPVCNINVAVNETWNDRQTNEKREKTTWYRCAFYGRQAEVVNTYVRKGSQIMVIGTVEARAYMDEKNNQPAASLELRAREIRLLGGRGDNTGSSGEYSSSGGSGDYDQGYAPPARDMDDIPF